MLAQVSGVKILKTRPTNEQKLMYALSPNTKTISNVKQQVWTDLNECVLKMQMLLTEHEEAESGRMAQSVASNTEMSDMFSKDFHKPSEGTDAMDSAVNSL